MPYFLSVTSLLVLCLTAAVPLSGGYIPEPADKLDTEGRTYLDQYLAATRDQEDKLRGVAMDIEIDASLPSMGRQGKFHALRHISKLGKITYRAITFQGDNTVKNYVIAKFLQAEKDTAEKNLNLARTPENYKFKYYGQYTEGDWKLHLFELTPKRKAPGLFNGWMWIEATTGLPVREQGYLVKNPSIYLKHVEFVRDYEIRDGIAMPVKVDSQIQTRIAGKAELSIRYSNLAQVPDDLASTPPAINR